MNQGRKVGKESEGEKGCKGGGGAEVADKLHCKRYCPFLAVIIALCKNHRNKNCKYLQCAKKWQTKTIFLALIIALQKSEPQIFAERKKNR